MRSQESPSRASRNRCVVVLTGNEKQGKIHRQLEAILSAEMGETVDVILICPCFAKNWSKSLNEFDRALGRADACVIGTYLPTELGKHARTLARRRRVRHVRTAALGCSGLSHVAAEALGPVQ